MYTYEDVLKAIQDSGVNMSDSDMKAAQSNPDKVMSIVNAKINFNKSTTPEQQAYWHGIAETNRSDIGYSGGDTGSDYISLNTPSSYSAATSAPTYDNQYADQIKSALDTIQNQKSWSYNPDTDQGYQAAKKQYLREADRSTANTMGQYASMTGGMPSTAAMTAGSQAGDYYKTQLSDQLGNYMNSDYQRYVDQLGANYDKLSALSSLEQGDYGKYQDQLAQYNTQNEFDYQKYLDNYDANVAKDQTDYERMQYDKEYADQQTQYLVDYYNTLYGQTNNSDYLTIAQNLAKSLDTTGIVSNTESQIAAAKKAAADAAAVAAKSGGSSGNSSSSSPGGSRGSYSNYNAGYNNAKNTGTVKNRDEYDTAARNSYKKRKSKS